MAFVFVYNLTLREFNDEQLEKIEDAIRLAIIDVIPEMEPVSGEIGFTFPQDPSVAGDSTDIPVRIVVEDLRDNLNIRGNLAKAIGERFKQASPKENRRVMVRIRKHYEYDGGEYDG